MNALKSKKIISSVITPLKAGLLTSAMCLVTTLSWADLVIDNAANVGIGTDTPTTLLNLEGGSLLVDRLAGAASDVLHVRNDGPARIAFDNTDSMNPGVWRFNHATNGAFRIADGVGSLEFFLTANGDMTINGELTTGGTTCGGGGCDYVFDSRYKLESIEEHASQMWSHKYLPAVGPTKENKPFNITKKTTGMLNELEKAHIYIEQLNTQAEKFEKELANRDELINNILARMKVLEAR